MENKQALLNHHEISAFCTQMAMILNSGISALEGLSILAEDAKGTENEALFHSMYEDMLNSGNLTFSLEESSAFPRYVLDMVRLGEQSGKLDEVLFSLSSYYDREARIARAVKDTVTYPLVMIVMMFVVIIVLLTRVMPILEQVFRSLGGEMTGLSRGILNIGTTLSRYSAVFLAMLIVLTAFLIYLFKTRKGKEIRSVIGPRFFITKRLYEKISCARFANGLALTISSGLDMEDSLDLVARLVDNRLVQKKITRCRELMAEGSSFLHALEETKIFTGLQARMVSVAFQTGSTDVAMSQIAGQYEEEVDDRLSALISILEPSLVAVLSIVVGMILLSVMLPLMGIMSGMN